MTHANCIATGWRASTTFDAMGKKVDIDDLIDAAAVAGRLGLSHRNVVSVYAKRYDDFPTPVLDFGSGRCKLWLREDVEAWARATGRVM